MKLLVAAEDTYNQEEADLLIGDEIRIEGQTYKVLSVDQSVWTLAHKYIGITVEAS